MNSTTASIVRHVPDGMLVTAVLALFVLAILGWFP